MPDIDLLRNRFFLLRHGRSEANEAGLIVSDPVRGAQGYGLTAQGREQVETSVNTAAQVCLADSVLSLVSSPFLRAQETAQIAARIWASPSFQTDDRLQERGCGRFEMAQDESYEEVWAQDRIDPEHRQEVLGLADWFLIDWGARNLGGKTQSVTEAAFTIGRFQTLEALLKAIDKIEERLIRLNKEMSDRFDAYMEKLKTQWGR